MKASGEMVVRQLFESRECSKATGGFDERCCRKVKRKVCGSSSSNTHGSRKIMRGAEP